MWLWIFTGLNIIMNVHGFASGGVLVACGSMVPQHFTNMPDEGTPPFYISYQEFNKEGSFIVFLQGNNSSVFKGFMLEAREEGGPSVGYFTPIDPTVTRLLDCDGVKASAVSHRNNQDKASFKVQWTAPVTRLSNNISFRATFVQSFFTFWVNVATPLIPPLMRNKITTTISTTTTAMTTTPPPSPPLIPPSISTTIATTMTTPPLPYYIVIVLMVIISVLVVMKMAMENMITTTVNKSISCHHLNRMSKIIFYMLCLAMEIASMVLLIVYASSQVTLIALLSVVIILNVLEIVLIFLPNGPNHELKDICNSVASVRSVILLIFTIAFIYVCYSEMDKKHPEPLLIAYTVWIFLFNFWVLVVTILQCRKKGSSKNRMQHSQQKREKMPHKAGVIVTTVFIIVSIALAIAVIVRILQHPNK